MKRKAVLYPVILLLTFSLLAGSILLIIKLLSINTKLFFIDYSGTGEAYNNVVSGALNLNYPIKTVSEVILKEGKAEKSFLSDIENRRKLNDNFLNADFLAVSREDVTEIEKQADAERILKARMLEYFELKTDEKNELNTTLQLYDNRTNPKKHLALPDFVYELTAVYKTENGETSYLSLSADAKTLTLIQIKNSGYKSGLTLNAKDSEGTQSRNILYGATGILERLKLVDSRSVAKCVIASADFKDLRNEISVYLYLNNGSRIRFDYFSSEGAGFTYRYQPELLNAGEVLYKAAEDESPSLSEEEKTEQLLNKFTGVNMLPLTASSLSRESYYFLMYCFEKNGIINIDEKTRIPKPVAEEPFRAAVKSYYNIYADTELYNKFGIKKEVAGDKSDTKENILSFTVSLPERKKDLTYKEFNAEGRNIKGNIYSGEELIGQINFETAEVRGNLAVKSISVKYNEILKLDPEKAEGLNRDAADIFDGFSKIVDLSDGRALGIKEEARTVTLFSKEAALGGNRGVIRELSYPVGTTGILSVFQDFEKNIKINYATAAGIVTTVVYNRNFLQQKITERSFDNNEIFLNYDSSLENFYLFENGSVFKVEVRTNTKTELLSLGGNIGNLIPKTGHAQIFENGIYLELYENDKLAGVCMINTLEMTAETVKLKSYQMTKILYSYPERILITGINLLDREGNNLYINYGEKALDTVFIPYVNTNYTLITGDETEIYYFAEEFGLLTLYRYDKITGQTFKAEIGYGYKAEKLDFYDEKQAYLTLSDSKGERISYKIIVDTPLS